MKIDKWNGMSLYLSHVPKYTRNSRGQRDEPPAPTPPPPGTTPPISPPPPQGSTLQGTGIKFSTFYHLYSLHKMSDRGRYADTWKQKRIIILTRIIRIQVHTVQPGNLRVGGGGGWEGLLGGLWGGNSRLSTVLRVVLGVTEEATGYVNERRQGEHDVMTEDGGGGFGIASHRNRQTKMQRADVGSSVPTSSTDENKTE